jgi:NodT family efflux transporter outer membrane factor (OMF) lipoprotein
MRSRITPLIFCALAAATVAGCKTVGPNYAGPPDARPPAAFARAADVAVANVPTAGPVPADWWTALGDKELDGLIDRALRANPNLDVARARLRQARAGLREERANNLPTGSASALAAHVRLPKENPLGGSSSGQSASESAQAGQSAQSSGFQLPSSLNLYNVGFDASWEIDLFGGQRRAVEAARATLDAAEAGVADAQVSLVADVASAYVNLRSAQQRLALADESVAREQRTLDLTAERVRGGTATELDLTRIQGQLESVRADREPLESQADGYRDALATLLGQAPGTLDAELNATPNDAAAVPLPPDQVAVGDPAAMLQRRPDIRAAERQLAAANARIGQAEAAKFPHLSLLGIIGIGGTRPSDLTHLDNFTAIAAPRLAWNVLDFGRNRARVDQAEGVRDEADAQYRVAVLGALRDAEDALARFRQGRVTVATAARAKAIADRAAFLMTARQQGGTATLIDVLDVERQQIAAAQNLAQAQAALTASFVALQKALGLGWQDAPGAERAVASAR